MSRYGHLFNVTHDDHWVWMGYVTRPRTRTHIRYEPAKYNKIEDLGSHYRYESKGEPRASFGGRSVPANRAVIADSLGITNLKELGTIRRTCSHPMCVNPKHYLVYRPTDGLPAPIITERVITLDDLIELDPEPGMGPMAAAIDLNVPSIPDDLWVKYLEHVSDE